MSGKIPSSLGHGQLTGLIRLELSESDIDGETFFSLYIFETSFVYKWINSKVKPHHVQMMQVHHKNLVQRENNYFLYVLLQAMSAVQPVR